MLLWRRHKRTVRLFGDFVQAKKRVWKLDGEVEKVLWNHLKPEQLLVSYVYAVVGACGCVHVHACGHKCVTCVCVYACVDVCYCVGVQASTDGHTVHCLDKNTDATLYQIHAHTDAISGDTILYE